MCISTDGKILAGGHARGQECGDHSLGTVLAKPAFQHFLEH